MNAEKKLQVLLSVLFFHLPILSEAQWINVGPPSFTPNQSDYPCISLNANDVPYLLFRDQGVGAKASLMNYTGSNWNFIGNRGISDGDACTPQLCFNSLQEPYIVFMDRADSNKVTVMKYAGNVWKLVGQRGFSPGAGSCTSIAMDENGVPYVAFRDVYYNYRASVMRFNGTNWEYFGTPGFSDLGNGYEGAWMITLKFDHSGVPYISFGDMSNNFCATVMKYDGSNWICVGNPGFAGWCADYTSAIDFDSNNVPYIVCSANGKAAVKKFDGTRSEEHT